MEKGGTFYAVGAGGSLTGKGANILLIDDPVKSRKEAESETVRKTSWEWYKGTAYTRLEKNAAIILIMTRWHEDDLAGHLESESKEEWVTLKLPAIAEQDEAYRRQGEALWPDKVNLETLKAIEGEVGAREWNSQFQQRPAAAEGEIFKREWWRYYKVPPTFTKTIQSWDTAFKAKSANDFSVYTTWGVAENGLYLLHRWKGRVEFPELKRTVKNLAEQFKPHEIDIEDKASGQSLIQELQRETSLPIIPVKVDKDKVARAHAITSYIEAGRVFLPEQAEWLQDYIDTMAVFPNGSHDDDVDSTTQALAKHMYLQKDGVFELYRELYEKSQSSN